MGKGTADAVRAYVERRLPDAQVAIVWANEAAVITVTRKGCEYSAKLEPEFLSRADAVQQVEAWNLVDEMCRAEGLELVVTAQGIRLSSSN